MIEVRKFEGRRIDLLPLLRLADDSEAAIESYYRLGEILAAFDDDRPVGLALVERDGASVHIISLAVSPCRQGEGVGCD